MAKKKVQELVNVRLESVSFVDAGANGRTFEIIKRKDKEPTSKPKQETDEQFENRLLENIKSFFTPKGKENGAMKKILEKLTKAVEALTGRVEKLEPPTEQEPVNPPVEGQEPAVESETETETETSVENAALVKAIETLTEKVEKLTAPPAEPAPAETAPVEEGSGEKELQKAVETLTARIAAMENARQPSNALPPDGKAGEQIDKAEDPKTNEFWAGAINFGL